MTRRPGRLAAASAVAGLAIFAGCSNGDALALARQACVHVDRSVALFHRADGEPAGPAVADRARALQQLHVALPLAATAAGQQAQWQALMTTISELSRVPPETLLNPLHEQCQVAESPGGLGGNSPAGPTGSVPTPTGSGSTTSVPTPTGAQ